MPATWSTALVTGASSGIGAALARRLAAEGTDLVLVARDGGRLDALAAELATPAAGAVRAEVLVADLAEPGQLGAVEKRLADASRPVDLVVNNAGFGTYGDFAGLDVEGEEREIAVNVLALVRLTHAALGAMLPRGRGAVVNVSSVAGLQATPGNATYGASKAFVATFGEAVAGELAGTGVTLTTVLPGFTRTEFHERAGIGGRKVPGPAWMSAADVAAETLDAARAGRPWLVPGMLNKLAAAAIGPVPRGLRRRLAARMAARM
jgi:short-subunit dehydrogenase